MKYHFKIFKNKNKGYWAQCVELEGCHTQADTKQQLQKNMSEALNIYLSEPPNSKHIFPSPRKSLTRKDLVKIEVSPSVAIAYRIRELRLKNNLTQIAMKDRLGIKNLSNYQRLEDPSRANPEWQTLHLIKKAFPNFLVDDLME